MESCPEGFRSLFDPSYVDYADADIRGTLQRPPQHLVHRVHAVACPAPGKVTVCHSSEGWRFLPGGRLEPGESIDRALSRELLEEAGARPDGSAQLFFSHIATSRCSRPYLPHVPHPVMWWTYAVVRTEIVGEPTCPDDAEQVDEVLHLPVSEAADWLSSGSDPMHADVVRLAAHLHLI